ncbi:hypothetical protein G6F57_017381 [Rhizopus arrhizus]|nr:hypothetical protein G6F57_017381 [Rhizopus arrhizus]
MGTGEGAAAKPWEGAEGLEWTVPSPAPFHTFETPPEVKRTRHSCSRTRSAGLRPCCVCLDRVAGFGAADRQRGRLGQGHERRPARNHSAQAEFPSDDEGGGVGVLRRAQGRGLPGRQRQAEPGARDRGRAAGSGNLRYCAGINCALGGFQPDLNHLI